MSFFQTFLHYHCHLVTSHFLFWLFLLNITLNKGRCNFFLLINKRLTWGRWRIFFIWINLKFWASIIIFLTIIVFLIITRNNFIWWLSFEITCLHLRSLRKYLLLWRLWRVSRWMKLLFLNIISNRQKLFSYTLLLFFVNLRWGYFILSKWYSWIRFIIIRLIFHFQILRVFWLRFFNNRSILNCSLNSVTCSLWAP